ncbi:MAG: hypothetical protein ACRESV_03035, partial [Nevskiales bacterium]
PHCKHYGAISDNKPAAGFFPSFPRRRESSQKAHFQNWVPAFAGTTDRLVRVEIQAVDTGY